jgi:hypothetical protein
MSDTEPESEQCPHEVIEATCGGCNCDCRSCVAINERLARRGS